MVGHKGWTRVEDLGWTLKKVGHVEKIYVGRSESLDTWRRFSLDVHKIWTRGEDLVWTFIKLGHAEKISFGRS